MLKHARSAISQTTKRSTYRHLAYLLSGGAAPMAYLVAYPLLTAAGVGPLWLWVLAALLLLAPGFVRPLRDLDRRWTNKILGTSVAKLDPVLRSTLGAAYPAWRRALRLTPPYEPWRGVVWFVVRTISGLQSAVAVSAVALALVALILALFGDGLLGVFGLLPVADWKVALVLPLLFPLLVLMCVGACVHANVGASLHADLAGVLLGATLDEQVAVLRRANDLSSERKRIADELHDSIGHDLAAVHVQAAAARHVFAEDREFAFRVLGNIEEITRASLEELGRVLAVLREDPVGPPKQPALRDLDGLMDRMRELGLPLTVEVTGDVTGVPDRLGRQAYRIVQEGCTNVMRHAGFVPTEVKVSVDSEKLEVVVSNEPPKKAFGLNSVTTGRRGLRGIEERVRELGGSFCAGIKDGGGYRLRVLLPFRIAGRVLVDH